MSKKIVSQAVLREMSVCLSMDGYEFVKKSSSSEENFFVFKKETGNCRIILMYSLSGRGNYAPSGGLNIIYKDLTTILKGLFEDSPIANDYDLENAKAAWRGVGINAFVGQFASDRTIYRCSTEEGAKELAINFSRQIKSEEDNFVTLHLDEQITIKKFMKPMHHFWPGSVKDFLEHLIAYGIKTSDPALLSYAFEKASIVFEKLAPEARPTDFMAVLKERTDKLDLMTA